MIQPRAGVSDICPQKDLFHDPRDVIITSQMAISALVDNDKVLPLAVSFPDKIDNIKEKIDHFDEKMRMTITITKSR